MSVILENKTVEKHYRPSRLPQARNPIYQKAVNVGCKFCVDKTGRKKNFKTLYVLYRHFTYHHTNEPTYKELTMNLADLVIEGSILWVNVMVLSVKTQPSFKSSTMGGNRKNRSYHCAKCIMIAILYSNNSFSKSWSLTFNGINCIVVLLWIWIRI